MFDQDNAWTVKNIKNDEDKTNKEKKQEAKITLDKIAEIEKAREEPRDIFKLS